jgi:protein-tyrosine phosphatase
VLCTANVCRSPMAAALLASRLAALGAPVGVRSAGQLRSGERPYPEAVRAMAGLRLDIAQHRSRQVTVSDLTDADLILAMARENLRHAVVLAPSAWPRAFTLKELVRRGETIGRRRAREPLADWLARAHQGRERAALLGDSSDDDIADPSGAGQRAYDRTAAALSGLVDQLIESCWRGTGPP